MASSSYIEVLCGGLEAGTKRALKLSFDYVLKNLRLGRPEHQRPSENLQAYFVTGRTPLVADTEFSIVHGLASAPYLAVPLLDLQAVGAATVPLEVTRPADMARLYLKSSETDAPFCLLIEAP